MVLTSPLFIDLISQAAFFQHTIRRRPKKPGLELLMARIPCLLKALEISGGIS